MEDVRIYLGFPFVEKLHFHHSASNVRLSENVSEDISLKISLKSWDYDRYSPGLLINITQSRIADCHLLH